MSFHYQVIYCVNSYSSQKGDLVIFIQQDWTKKNC